MKRLFLYTCLLAQALPLTSCGDDPKLVAKRESQKVEIARLTGELELIEEKLKNLPPDVSRELEEARARADEQIREVTGLEEEVAALEARRNELKAEFDAYKAKYPIP